MESAAANTTQLQAAVYDNTPSCKAIHKVTARKQATRKVKPEPSGQINKNRSCFRCGKTSHSPNDCYHKDVEYRFCKKIGHIESKCFFKTESRKGESRATYNMFSLTESRPDPFIADIQVGGERYQWKWTQVPHCQ